MKARKSTVALETVFAVLFCAVLFSYCVFPRTTEGKTLTSRIMEPSAVSSAETITIRNLTDKQSVELRKNNGLWFVRAAGKSTVAANGQKIETMLAALSRQRVLHTMPADTGHEIQHSITIVAADGTILSDIAFHGTDASGGRILFSTARDITVLRTENDLSFCEDATTAGWIRHEAFADMEEVSEAQRLIYRKGAFGLALGRENADFADFMQTLSSIACLDSELPSAGDETIRVEFGDASERTFSLSSLGADYRITENDRAWRISAWSYARMKSALGIGAP